MADIDYEALMWALGLLAIPLWMALPARILWRKYTGNRFEHDEYRRLVKKVLDGGYSLEQFRIHLEDERRRRHIDKDKARLIETDVLYPLSIPHFLLLPALIFSPLAVLLAFPLIVLALPMMVLLEWVLIEKRGLIVSLGFLQNRTKWQVIHIPQPHRGHANLREDIVSFHRMPRAAFLGMFAWLMVHWILQSDEWWVELMIGGVVYLALLSVIEVVSTALDAELVFADPAGSRLIPVDKWLLAFIQPLIGVGLLFLLGRDILHEARSSSGDAVLFSLIVLIVLFAVTVVGLGVEVGFSRRRGETVRRDFAKQVIEKMSPLSYTYTRHGGRLELHVSCSMSERVERGDLDLDEPRKDVDFTFVDELRSTTGTGAVIPPTSPTGVEISQSSMQSEDESTE